MTNSEKSNFCVMYHFIVHCSFLKLKLFLIQTYIINENRQKDLTDSIRESTQAKDYVVTVKSIL